MSQSDTAQTAPRDLPFAGPHRMLVVHCSDTPDDQPIGAKEIQEMHLGWLGRDAIIR